jgi:hypothetical protein
VHTGQLETEIGLEVRPACTALRILLIHLFVSVFSFCFLFSLSRTSFDCS